MRLCLLHTSVHLTHTGAHTHRDLINVIHAHVYRSSAPAPAATPATVAAATVAAATVAAPARVAAAPAAAAAATALPAGWYAAIDEPTGKEYYYNAEGAVTWERPQ
jgi:hypothetical protein